MYLKLSQNAIYKIGNTLQKKENIFFRILVVFLLFSIVLKQWNNKVLIKDKQSFICYYLIL